MGPGLVPASDVWAFLPSGWMPRETLTAKTMNSLIIAVNLGKVRVLGIREAGDDPQEKRHLVEERSESVTDHVKSIHETVTDQSGRFRQGSPAGVKAGMSYGEEHELEAEIERQALQRTAGHIGRILAARNHPRWVLVAPRTMLARLLAVLPMATLDTLAKSVGGDLTSSPLIELEKRFL